MNRRHGWQYQAMLGYTQNTAYSVGVVGNNKQCSATNKTRHEPSEWLAIPSNARLHTQHGMKRRSSWQYQAVLGYTQNTARTVGVVGNTKQCSATHKTRHEPSEWLAIPSNARLHTKHGMNRWSGWQYQAMLGYTQNTACTVACSWQYQAMLGYTQNTACTVASSWQYQAVLGYTQNTA